MPNKGVKGKNNFAVYSYKDSVITSYVEFVNLINEKHELTENFSLRPPSLHTG
jgi:hypothetical protein